MWKATKRLHFFRYKSNHLCVGVSMWLYIPFWFSPHPRRAVSWQSRCQSAACQSEAAELRHPSLDTQHSVVYSATQSTQYRHAVYRQTFRSSFLFSMRTTGYQMKADWPSCSCTRLQTCPEIFPHPAMGQIKTLFLRVVVWVTVVGVSVAILVWHTPCKMCAISADFPLSRPVNVWHKMIFF